MIFGRKIIEIERQDSRWIAYYPGAGLRRRAEDIYIPDELAIDELANYLADLFHELATRGHTDVERI